MTISAAMRAQLQAVDDPSGLLLLVLIDSEHLSGPVRVVSDTRDWLINGESFIGIPLEVTLPQDVAQQATRAQLEIDNVGQDLLGELEDLPLGVGLDVTMRIVSRAAPDTVEWEYSAAMSRAVATVPRIVIVLGDDSLFRQSAVLLRYDPTTAPGLYAG